MPPTNDFNTDNPLYVIHPHHRNGMRTKSQWTIPQPEEMSCFSDSYLTIWRTHGAGWGLHVINLTPNFLGISKDQLRNLFIAKFVCKAGQQEWHGYPADHQIHTQDRPTTEILNSWLNSNILPAAKIRKISKGQPCSL